MKISKRLISQATVLASASFNVSATCHYEDADLYDGWGWDPVAMLSCAPEGMGSESLQPRDLDGDLTTVEAYYYSPGEVTWLADANLGLS